jgi:formate hydrogenlyase subunit 4
VEVIFSIYHSKFRFFKLSLNFKILIFRPMASKTAAHILGSSLNLLSICLIILTSIHLTKSSQQHLIDELTCVLAFILTATSILSFNSIRKDNLNHERYAEYLFMGSIIGVLGIVIYIVLYFWMTGTIPFN